MSDQLTISSFIALLSKMLEEHGDLPMYITAWAETENRLDDVDVFVGTEREAYVDRGGYPYEHLPKRVVIVADG